jgi:hypothetical protein
VQTPYPGINQHDCRFRRISCLDTKRTRSRLTTHVTCDNPKSYATIKCAKQGAILMAIGMGSLTIGRFRIQTFICRNHELQHSLLGLNPLMIKGCTAEFTNRYFKLNHASCLQPLIVGYKHHRPTLWRVTIPPPKQDTIAIPRAIASDPFLAHTNDDTTTASLKCDEILDNSGSSSAIAPTQKGHPYMLTRTSTTKRIIMSQAAHIKSLYYISSTKTPIQYKGCLRLGNKGCSTYWYSRRN